MELRQARRIEWYVCRIKRKLTAEEASLDAEELGIDWYCCPFSEETYHYHLTSGRRSRSWSTIARAADRLGRLGLCE